MKPGTIAAVMQARSGVDILLPSLLGEKAKNMVMGSRPLRGRVVSLMAANCTVLVTCLATFEQGGKYGSQIIRSRSIVRHPVDQLAEVVSMISQGVHVI